ncbi:MAG: hypothetical protein CMM75_01360 [Rhodospirillaceae bacterium]|nr:hypothetical protein [Rhodospirillaceae bacterium]
METAIFEPGGYRYIRGPFQYSGGVAAEPGFSIERVRFRTPLAIEDGFLRIEAHLKKMGLPLTSFCACELRSPAPFTEEGFINFNRSYVGTLERWGIFRDDENPVARSNVCPAVGPPLEPSFQAFSYTVPVAKCDGSFVIAGSAEAPEGQGNYNARIIRLGDQSSEAMREKALYVLCVMENRMAALGKTWTNSTATTVYTVYDFHTFFEDEIVIRGAVNNGLTWVYARPPVEGLDFEMDVRGVLTELII